jgi:Skp family chaperone for outer membrane proteins
MSRLLLGVIFTAIWLPAAGIAQTASQTPAVQPAASGAQMKLAWVNLEQAVFSCEEGKKEFGDIQKFVDGKNAELEGYRKDSDALKNKLSVQGSKLTDEARAELEDDIEAKDTAMQRFQQDTQKDIENRKQRAANYIGKRMQSVIEKTAKEKGFSAVLFFNPNRDAWVDPALIITDDVVKAYNQTYPPPSAAKTPAAAPAKKP